MPFALEPNPRLYKSLFERWQQEEDIRYKQAMASNAIATSQQYLFLLYLLIIVIIFQISMSSLRGWYKETREIRQQIYLQHERDLENGKITFSGDWDTDFKDPVSCLEKSWNDEDNETYDHHDEWTLTYDFGSWNKFVTTIMPHDLQNKTYKPIMFLLHDFTMLQ